MLLKLILKLKFVSSFLRNLDQSRIDSIITRIEPFLSKKNKIIDIGVGLGLLSSAIQKKGYYLCPVDVHNISIAKDIKPVLFDGQALPFKNNSFDTALLITVLHHTPNPEKIILETSRVAKKIIIMEDIFESTIHKYLTFIMDSIMNLEFFGHPHTNKSDKGWRKLFKKNKFTVLKYDRKPYWNFFISAIYVISK